MPPVNNTMGEGEAAVGTIAGRVSKGAFVASLDGKGMLEERIWHVIRRVGSCKVGGLWCPTIEFPCAVLLLCACSEDKLMK